MSRVLEDLARRVAAKHLVSTTDGDRVLYFAYGHNMDLDSLRERAPSALDLGVARIVSHRVVFDAASVEESTTWATIEPAAGMDVWGVVFAIEASEMAALDAAETGYIRTHMPLLTFDGRMLAGQVYIATDRASHASPAGWYVLGMLREGGRRGFPLSYLNAVEAAAGSAVALGSRTASTGYFQVGEEILFGKYKNKRGKILRFYVDDRGVPMVEIEPIPKGRKKNREMGLYNFWHLPERRHPPKKTAAYSDDFLKSVKNERFRHPKTNRRVLFKSLPLEEQQNIHAQWEERHSPKSDSGDARDVFGVALSAERKKAIRDLAAKTDEELERMDTEELDKVAFGFTNGETREVPLNALNVVYDSDIENAEHAVGQNPKKWEKYLDEPIQVKLKGGKFQIEDGHHRYVTSKRKGLKTIKAEMSIDDNPIKAIRELAKSMSKSGSMRRSACIIAGKKFGDRLCLLKNRDRAYDADLAIVHLEKEGTEIAVVYDLVTGYMEGVNEFGIGIVNTTLMVLRDEAEGKSQGKKNEPMRSKDGPKIVRALAKRTLEEAVQSLTYDGGGIRGHTFVADGERIVSIECSRKHPARVTTLDPDRINTRTNHGVSYPEAGYTHGPDYISSIVRRWEAQKRLQTIRRPEAAAVALVEAIDEADSPFNPVRVTDHMRTTSQLTIDTTNPALFLYLIPGHAEVKKTRNLLPGERKPKIPVRVFRYKNKMEDRKPPKPIDKTAKRELLDVTAIEKLRKDFLMLMKNAGVVKNYAQAMAWREAVQVWSNRFNHIIFEQLVRSEFKELARAKIITQSEAEFWAKKIGKECWPLYIEFRVPILKANPSDGFYGTEDYAFAKMMKELPKWKGRVERAARQAWAALKDMVTWFANHRQHPMTVDVLTVENESMEGFQVALRGVSDDAYDTKGSVERFKEGLRLYKQRARLVLPLLLQAQLPLVLDFKMGLDAGGRYYGQYIGISALETIGRPERLAQVLAHEMGHHLYDTYLSGEDRKFWNAAITGNYGKLDLHEVLRRYGSEKDFILNDRIRQEDPILYLQIEGLHADPSSERVFQSMWKMDDLREYLAEGGQAVWTVHGKPITGYANKNNEEAFCEAIGMLVGYGPRAVLPEVREWLKTILPSLKVAFERIAKARYKSKKKVKTQDGDEMVVYEYGPRQVANRNKEKAERVEKLRGSISKLRKKVNTDLTSKDEHVAAVALAVGLMDETYERVGNDASAEDGHFGVTTWQVQHVKFNGGKATVSYVGKSGVKQKKTVSTPALVKALRSACKGKGKDACMLEVSASDVNEYLKPFDITAKDLRGFHANREMSERLKAVRKAGPKLPAGRKEKDEILKKEFKKALGETAKAVGHTESTLRSQYLVPGLEDDYMKDGTVSQSLVKKSSASPLRPTGERAMGDGRVFTMPLREDAFIHFTPSERALGILRSKKLLMNPPYQKFGIDAVNAISTTYGKFVPGVQTTHIKDDTVVGILFSTNTPPERGYLEEVIWKQDVTLINPKLLPLARAAAMLNSSPTKLGDQDVVVYNRTTKAAASLRIAALRGTPTERRILSASVMAPVFVSRSRQWWIANAPNLYRIAREFEQPRPTIEGLRFPPEMFSMLWYEDEAGNRLPDTSEAEQMDGSYVPAGANTQHSRFPNELHHNILILNEDGTSSSLGSMNSTYSSELLTAMIRSGEWDAADAIQVAGQSCERCMNVLYNRYGLKDGYPFGSDAYWRCGTRCTMCEHLVGDPREDSARARIERTAAPSYDAYVQRKKDRGEQPLKRDEWEARVLGGDEDVSNDSVPSKEEWSSLREKLRDEHGLETFHAAYRPENKHLSIDNIVVPKANRGKGSAGQAMKKTLAWADEHDITVTLSPTSEFGSSKKKLETWYRSMGFVPNKGRNKDFRFRETMIRLPKTAEKKATKSPAEVEDEKVQKMLRPEPKKKPPRYDLRDNRTLDEDDEDLKGTGGGDDGDRDLSLKWNKVANRVAFRWLVIPTSPSAQRVALWRRAKDTDKSEFLKEMEGKPFRHPETGNDVSFKSLPNDEQHRLYERWKSDREDEESGAEELKDEDVEEVDGDTEELDDEDLEDVDETDPDELDPPEDLFDGLGEDAPEEAPEKDTPDEGGAPEETSKPEAEKPAEEAKKPEPKEKGKRTKEDIEQELEEARDRVEDLEAAIVKAKNDIKDGKEEIVEISKLLEKASPQNKQNILVQIKSMKKKIRDGEDLIDEHHDELKQTQQKVKKLKQERKAPAEADQKREESEARTDQKERSRKLVQETRGALQSLVGEGSEVPKAVQRQIEEAVSGLDEQQVEDFSVAFQDRMKDLVGLDPMSEGALSIANRASRLQDVSGIEDPERLAEQLAENAYASQVVANPMIVAGKPVGGRKMDPKAYGERANEAFAQFKGLHKHLRQFAGEQIASALKGLDEEDDKAKELNAILSGINAAHVADTGEALEGRPQPSKGHAALVKKLVETGNAEHMFKPLEDFFADDSRAAMSQALREMDDGDVAEFITGGDSNHPWSKLTEQMKEPGASEYKQMLKDFLIQDFLNDTWGDRAARDVMEAAGIAGADSPEARAKILGEAKAKGTGSVAAALEAMERVSEAARRGEAPAPEDDAVVRATFEGEASKGLVDGAKSLLDTLKSKFKKHVVSPAMAVLNHFVSKRDPEVLGQETIPHPDDARPTARDVAEDGDDDHKAGEVWKTEAGNWRAKNKDGAPKTFKDQAKAKSYADGEHEQDKPEVEDDDFSGEFKIDVEDKGPTKFAHDLAEAWLDRVRKMHPDASNRPLIVLDAA